MANKRAKLTGKGGNGRFFGLPLTVIDSPAYRSLNGWAVKLLIDIGKQYNGSNNGDLQAAYSLLKHCGWNSPGTLRKALQDLQTVGLIELTRQGGRHRCALYALTWYAIDECKGKLDVPETRAPSNKWKQADA